jgi:hypothetical protein
MIAPLDTTVHLHKLHAPDPGLQTWSLEASMGQHAACHTEQYSSSADTIPLAESAHRFSGALVSSAKSGLLPSSLQHSAMMYGSSSQCGASATLTSFDLCMHAASVSCLVLVFVLLSLHTRPGNMLLARSFGSMKATATITTRLGRDECTFNCLATRSVVLIASRAHTLSYV